MTTACERPMRTITFNAYTELILSCYYHPLLCNDLRSKKEPEYDFQEMAQRDNLTSSTEYQ